ncbi:hypothetical protein NC653_041926 [Populus alba x Populus x berolinensis]|uniref:Uncharacterized protein n=1 Tax=Populus alba x Populus x berolinensis TaxID=444605 RepID=A0AAD6L9R1_9ROSI|nr:hypothetical protein NC653_041926 [Populus alba x Populus x berolinensis]
MVEDTEETVGLLWFFQGEAMVDGWLMSLQLKMMAILEATGVRQWARRAEKSVGAVVAGISGASRDGEGDVVVSVWVLLLKSCRYYHGFEGENDWS